MDTEKQQFLLRQGLINKKLFGMDAGEWLNADEKSGHAKNSCII